MALVYTIIIAFSAFIHGVVGIGFPLVATPLLAFITDVKSAVVLLVLPTLVLNIANILKGGRWQNSIAQYWPLAVYGMMGSFIGTRLLVSIPGSVFRLVLSGAILFYLNAERIGVGFSWVQRSPGAGMAVFGLMAGLLGGTVNVMLPALIIFALEMKMDKVVMIQVFNFCFLLGKLTQGGVLAVSGLFSFHSLMVSVLLSVTALVVMLAGMKLRDRINSDTYRRWLRRLLAVLAIVLLGQWVYL